MQLNSVEHDHPHKTLTKEDFSSWNKMIQKIWFSITSLIADQRATRAKQEQLEERLYWVEAQTQRNQQIIDYWENHCMDFAASPDPYSNDGDAHCNYSHED